MIVISPIFAANHRYKLIKFVFFFYPRKQRSDVYNDMVLFFACHQKLLVRILTKEINTS